MTYSRWLTLWLCILVNSPSVLAVDLHWSSAGDRCLYFDQQSGNEHAFFIIDIASGKRLPAFDPELLSKSFSQALSRKVTSESLKISEIGFTDSRNELLVSGFEKLWRLDLDDYSLTVDQSGSISSTADQLFLPPRDSQRGGQSTSFQIRNEIQEPIRLIWIDFSGREREYDQIKPGELHRQHSYVDHVWLLKNQDGENLACFKVRPNHKFILSQENLDNVKVSKLGRSKRTRKSSQRSPDGRWTVSLRDQQVWVEGDNEELRVSDTGSSDSSFTKSLSATQVYWSPNSQYFVAVQTNNVPERTVYFVESSPADRLQPQLHQFPYRKPGDELPVPNYRLFSIDEAKEISISQDLFPNPWSMRFVEWSASSESFRILYNQRGHQVLRLLDVNASNGDVRALIEEQSETFIHYSSPDKAVLENLSPDSILWSSERTGWNHLYRYSANTGEQLNPVTSGEWNVRRIKKIDRERQIIWFDAVGIVKDQDPYHEHFCRVNFDGSNLQLLTEGDGTHSTEFEREGKYFIDEYSRVDLAPIQELRDSETGQLICELSRQPTEEKFQGRRITERFVAKGRDSETEIWGIIHWPKDFDPSKKYPVVEYIYAGPHDHHVPKSFRSNYRHQYQIADAGMIVVQIDAGMIVVQIDGMGTAWRSKEFHDVCYKNLRDAGFPDRIAWIKTAAEAYPQMDLERVGIYGGSAGGQNAMAALLWHNDFYKVAVADCGCHDNRMDKIWWNEQWMGWPIDESYKRNSNMENAHLLKGNLMLIVGELDRNVDPATTTQVVHQLIKHDKDFEFVLVAGAGHGAAETPWASRKRLNFLKQHLLQQKQ